MTIQDCKPGQRVRITQEIERREGNWQRSVEGVVEEIKLQKTGSWYAHAKDDRLWLARLKIRKPDGELSLLSIDPLTQIELVADSART